MSGRAVLLSLPYWRLSAVYFCYFASLGSWVPYWSPYLNDVALFSAEQIGIVMGLAMFTRVVGPLCWGFIAEGFFSRLTVTRIGACLACISFCGFFWVRDLVAFCLTIFCFSFFWQAILSQFEAITLEYLGAASHHYSRIRLWGSVGFIASVVLLGWFFSAYALDNLIWLMLIQLIAILLALMLVPNYASKKLNSQANSQPQPQPQSLQQPQSQSKPRQGISDANKDFIQRCRQPSVYLLMTVFFLVQLAFGPFYTFFTIYLQQLGYNSLTIAGLWVSAILAEIALFMLMSKLLQRFSWSLLMHFTLWLSALRWYLTASAADQFIIILQAQILHAVSFACMHALSMHWLKANFPNHLQSQAQATYSAVSYGLGGALGAYLSGVWWQSHAGNVFYMAALSCVLAIMVFTFAKVKVDA